MPALLHQLACRYWRSRCGCVMVSMLLACIRLFLCDGIQIGVVGAVMGMEMVGVGCLSWLYDM